MAYLLGVDLGTSSAKAYIMDEYGREAGIACREYDIHIPYPGYAEQNCDFLWESAACAVEDALHKAGIPGSSVLAVGVTGQMHGLVIIDEAYRVIRPAIIWADQRSSRQVQQLKALQIEERVANPAFTGFLLPSLLWLRENEEEHYKKIKKILLPKDYIRYRMCGEIGTDISDATGTLLYNCEKGQWDYELAERLDIPVSIFPECHDSLEIAGGITAECAAKTGLIKGTPVIYGGGDTPMQLLGNGLVKGGQLATNIGTASQLNCVCDTLCPDKGLRLNTFHHIPPEKWLLIGASLNGGIVLKWMQNNLLYDMKSFEDMSRCAHMAPAGAEGLICLPFLNGERSPYMDEHAKGIFWGLNLGHGRAHMIRAAMEGVVYSLRDCMEILKEIGIPLGDKIIAAGGGARSPLWLQMQADILGKEVYVTDGVEEACKGAAIAAGVGTGIFSTLEEACSQTIKLKDKVFFPDETNKNMYEENFKIYRELYQSNKKLF